jgi:peptide/nickel transport system permease protein
MFGVFAALIPGATIAILAISINFIVDWIGQRKHGVMRGVKKDD